MNEVEENRNSEISSEATQNLNNPDWQESQLELQIEDLGFGRRNRKQPNRFTLGFGRDSHFGIDGEDIVTFQEYTRKSKKRSLPLGKKNASSENYLLKSYYPQKVSYENKVQQPFGSLNGRDLDLEKTFSYHSIDSNALSSKIEECSSFIDFSLQNPDDTKQSIINQNRSIWESANIYPIQVSLHGPIIKLKPLTDVNGEASSAPSTVEEYFLLPQPYYHNGNPVYAISNPSNLNESANEVQPPSSEVSPAKLTERGKDASGPVEVTALPNQSKKPRIPRAKDLSKSRFPPITLFKIPGFVDCRFAGGKDSFPVKVSFFEYSIFQRKMTGYIFSLNRNDNGYQILFLHKNRIYSVWNVAAF